MTMKRLEEKRRAKNKLKKNSFKKIAIIVGASLTTLGIFLAFFSGELSFIINVRPPIEYGKKETTLNCNYKNIQEEITIQTYSNINNYYDGLARKNNALNNGDYSKLTYINSSDNIVKYIAGEIRLIGEKRNLNSDQLVELASCFVQNIPYDDAKAEYVLSTDGGNNDDTEQFPYETLHKNSGICTDKTYLGSAIIQELGYGTGIMLFPDAEHMALGIKVPSGYSDFGTKYTYAEMTTPDFAIGEVPSEVSEANGRPAVSIKTISDLKIDDNPTNINLFSGEYIENPNLVIDVNDGKEYQRIVEIVNLEDSIINEYQELLGLDSTIDAAYSELIDRENYMDSTYSTYLYTSDTTLDCGYKYNYGYSYYYDYGYSSRYEYRCDTVTNPAKNRAYNTYSYAVDSYNNQVNHYNKLLDQFNSKAASVRDKVNRYKNYEYN